MDSENDIKTIAEVGIHVRYLRKEVDALSKRITEVATKTDLKELELELRREIEENKPSALFRSVTQLATGIVALGAAVGMIIAVLKWAHAI